MNNSKDDFLRGWMAAVGYIENRANDYLNEHATNEPDTGATVFRSNDHRLYYEDLTELVDDLKVECELVIPKLFINQGQL